MLRLSRNIGIYLRLSDEDYDVGSDQNGTMKEESNSISNQRKLIENFLKRRKEFLNSNLIEYCDDGYSGTNFNRPNFQKMIADAECRKIDTIIFKDYSRFGRNFLGVGKYLEEIFPELQIRVISINDGYDSNELDSSEGITIPMMNLINDYYIKDLSKKVKSGIKSRQNRGDYISPIAIFGYKKNPVNKHQLIIDEETAPIVQMIFQYALDGLNGVQIAKKLNELNIMTPAWYARAYKKRNYPMDNKTIWTSAKVIKILRDQRYAGDMVGNVRVRTKIARTDNIKVDRENWIIVEGTHEGIVAKDIFLKVNNDIMPLGDKKDPSKGKDRRKGIFYCPHCGRLLRKTNTTINPYYECARGSYEPKSECTKIRVSEKRLIEIITDMIRAYMQVLIEGEILIREIKRTKMKESQTIMTAADVDAAVNKLMQSKMSLYERYRDGVITKDEYILRKQQITMQIDELESKKVQIANDIGSKEEQDQLEQKMRELIEKYKNMKEISYSDISEFASKVIVTTDVDVSVVWRFEDIGKQLIRLLEHRSAG